MSGIVVVTDVLKESESFDGELYSSRADNMPTDMDEVLATLSAFKVVRVTAPKKRREGPRIDDDTLSNRDVLFRVEIASGGCDLTLVGTKQMSRGRENFYWVEYFSGKNLVHTIGSISDSEERWPRLCTAIGVPLAHLDSLKALFRKFNGIWLRMAMQCINPGPDLDLHKNVKLCLQYEEDYLVELDWSARGVESWDK